MKTKRLATNLMGSICVILALMLLLAVARQSPAASASAATPAGKVYNWTISTWIVPPTVDIQLGHFIKTVKELSQGRIQLKLAYAGTVVPAMKMFEGVHQGALDMAYNPGTYQLGLVPVCDAFQGWPFTLENKGEIDHFLYELNAIDINRRAYADGGWNVELIGFAGYYPYGHLISTKPIRTNKDFKGLKFRLFGADGEIKRALGGAITVMPGSEIYTALATGVVDAVTFTGVTQMYAMGFHEVAKYLIMPATNPCIIPEYIINKKLWNELPSDLKTVLTAAVKIQASYDHMQYYGNWEPDYTKKMMKAGVQVINFSQEDIEEQRKISLTYLDERAKKDKYTAEYRDKLVGYLKFLGRIK